MAGLLCTAAAQAAPQDPARAGWEAIQRGDGDKAEASFRAALAANPNDPRALTGAGMAAHLLARDDQAVTFLKRAIAVDARYAYSSYVLGQIAYAQGDLDLAIKSFERVETLAPGNPAIRQQIEAWRKEAALHETFTAQPTGRFTVMFEGEAQQAIATRVSAQLEAAYARVGKALNAYAPETVTAILYTGEQFSDITKSPAWAAASYDGRIRIPVRGALKDPAELDRVVTHEFVHAVIHQVYPRIPKWLNEGLATYLEPGEHTSLLARLRGATATIPLARLNDAFQTTDDATARLAYSQSYVAARLLSERLGGNFPVFLQYVSDGTTIDEALMVFNISSVDIEGEWMRLARVAR